ncbi:DUF2335 domain-containing protein [Fusobacterium nucleatum]
MLALFLIQRHFIKYNQIYPNLGKEIVEMAKKQSEHRQYLESEQVISEQN